MKPGRELEVRVQKASRAAEVFEWYNKPRMRTRQDVIDSGAYVADRFRTSPQKDSSVEKTKYLDRLERDTKKPQKRVVVEEEFDETKMLREEIEDRKQWLDDMVSIGRDGPYRTQIQQEIREVCLMMVENVSSAAITEIFPMKYLVALDFDFTVIDEDSDHYIFKQLSPPLFEKLEALQGKIQWTDLMNQLLQEVQDLGKTQEDMNSVLETIPFDPAMKRAFEHFSRLSKVVIISDANTFYIDVITRAKGIHPYISQVITNPAILEKRVSIKRHTVEPHGCPKCAVNLCKGRELERYIQEHGPFERVIYGGDGRNDFCPSTRLRKSDLVLVRSNRALDKMLKDPHIRDQIQAQVEFWETASDFESLIKKHVH